MTSQPTAQNMDELVRAYSTIGYYFAQMEGDAELAKSEREYAEAEAVQAAKMAEPKTSAAQLEAIATIKTREYRRAEIKARTNAVKMKNLWLSIEQAINAVKFIDRNTGVRMGA